MQFIIAAISLGLLGSLHCVGMCGPLALALPVHNKSAFGKFFSVIGYNFGRAVTYSGMGALVGLAGQGFSFFGLQQALSITLGIIILVFLFLPARFSSRSGFLSKVHGLFYHLKSKLTELLIKKDRTSFLGVGILNGLLPCGLVYMALAGAAATGSVKTGIVFMFIFGLSTIPVMFLLMWFGHMINIEFRSVIRKFYPVLVSMIAVMMIVRGLSLGIPYLSPKMEKENTSVSCHTKTPKVKCCNK